MRDLRKITRPIAHVQLIDAMNRDIVITYHGRDRLYREVVAEEMKKHGVESTREYCELIQYQSINYWTMHDANAARETT